MKIEPGKIEYLESPGRFLGNICYERIELMGERLDAFTGLPFQNFQELKVLTG